MTRFPSGTCSALASLVLAGLSPALAQDSPRTATLLAPADLPPEIIDMQSSLGICAPLSELSDRTAVVVDDGHFAFSRLFIVPCGGGGFNLTSLIFVEAAGEIALAELETYSNAGWQMSAEVFNAEWEPEYDMLVTFEKGRSFGDCGGIGGWWFRDGTLTLASYTYHPTCDGSMTPGEFPIVFENEG